MHTGFGSEEIAVQALHKGAIDHISKDRLSKDRLGGAIKAALETWTRKRAEEGSKRKNNDKAEDINCCNRRKMDKIHSRLSGKKAVEISAHPLPELCYCPFCRHLFKSPHLASYTTYLRKYFSAQIRVNLRPK